jgi:hypothetical protein
MFKFSRRAAVIFALIILAFGLGACSKEPAQRQAFIDFLQRRIIEKPGLHIPIMSDQDIANFGPYADQYRIMNGFHHRLNDSITQDLARAMQIGSPRSLQELVNHRDILPVLKAGMANMKSELDKAEAEADAAHKALQQPADLKVVYDAAYDHMVTKPAAVYREVIPAMQSALPAVEDLAAFLDENRSAIEFRDNTPVSANTSVQTRLAGLMQSAMKSSQASDEAKRKLHAMVEGN